MPRAKSELAKTEDHTIFPYLIYFKRNLKFSSENDYLEQCDALKPNLDVSFKMSPYFIVKDKMTLNNTLKNKKNKLTLIPTA